MQNQLMGKPSALKQVNLSAVRGAIMKNGSATRAEIANTTRISVTTVRALLTEMQENNEIIELGHDESMGGRKAVRYELNKNCFFGVALCLGGEKVRYLIVNICGEICESGAFEAEENPTGAVCDFLDGLVAKMKIRSIGIGVPGVVNGMCYERKSAGGKLESCPLGEVVHSRYGMPVVLENDINAIALGFGRCYLKSFPEESCENTHMAYIYFEKDCLSAGFLSSGRILRGWNNFVGELGLFPATSSQTLDELLALPLADKQYSSLVAKVIAGICCVLNPQFIAVGGSAFRKACLPLVSEYFYDTLPLKMSAEILYAEDKWHDYYEGMAHLTAEQIFVDVRLVKE